MEIDIEPTLKNILDQTTLKWIFVGGKGGVGKTTTSCSLATLSAMKGKRVLIISTDPAHNLSDCFDQQFNGQEPTPVNGIENLWALEIDPKIDPNQIKFPSFLGQESQIDSATQTFLSEILSAVPGIDEAMSFSELINSLENMSYDLIIFDTAPTGHTLRLLNFPELLDKGLDQVITLKQQFSNLMGQFAPLMGGPDQMESAYEKVFGNLEQMKKVVEKVNDQMKDAKRTTFIAVCIPEFLSLYETERLIQELTQYNIDIHNIVINQVLFPDDACQMCVARSQMQKQYIDQMLELYEDFHLVVMPLQQEEVRGYEQLKVFCELLLTPKQVPEVPKSK